MQFHQVISINFKNLLYTFFSLHKNLKDELLEKKFIDETKFSKQAYNFFHCYVDIHSRVSPQRNVRWNYHQLCIGGSLRTTKLQNKYNKGHTKVLFVILHYSESWEHRNVAKLWCDRTLDHSQVSHFHFSWLSLLNVNRVIYFFWCCI